MLYPSGFDSNVGFFEAMLGPDDIVISDAYSHASLIDGIRLSKAKHLIYNHLDMQDLERQLEAAKISRLKVVVTEGVYSMDGQIAPLD